MENNGNSGMRSSGHPLLPPGFRFHPTDEELVVHYLKKKVASVPLPVSIIADIDLYKFDPWELPSKATFGEQEWYFFSPRDRKYPNGARPNRAATSGYWKATGTDKPILTSNNHKVGVKKALVFYGGKPPKGIKTNWIMHEFRLTDANPPNAKPEPPSARKASLRLDDWVLCRIYKKNTSHRPMDQRVRDDLMEGMIKVQHLHHQNQKSSANSSSSVLDNNVEEHFFVDSTLVSSGSNGSDHLPLMKRNNSTLSNNNNNSQYWISETNSGSYASSFQNKRFHGDLNNGVDNNNDNNNNNNEDNNSFVSMLREINPQNSGFHHGNGVVDSSLADHHHHHHGVLRQAFQLPNMNWNS